MSIDEVRLTSDEIRERSRTNSPEEKLKGIQMPQARLESEINQDIPMDSEMYHQRFHQEEEE
jgi:hypothetical protein